MTRLVELALLLTPVAAWLLWRTLVARGVPNPSRQTLLALVATVVLFAAALAWTSLSDRHPEGTRYVPAQFEGGRVVPGHGG